jgi:hypothetical protein
MLQMGDNIRQCKLADKNGRTGWNRIREWNVGRPFGPGRMPLPNIGSMDGNTGRSEGATAEKAVPFPCAVRDPNRSFVEVRAGEPRLGARSARMLAQDSVPTHANYKAQHGHG